MWGGTACGILSHALRASRRLTLTVLNSTRAEVDTLCRSSGGPIDSKLHLEVSAEMGRFEPLAPSTVVTFQNSLLFGAGSLPI
jgi:hypothetical protein